MVVYCLFIFYEQLIYEKLPKDISERHVLLLDPVLATGDNFFHTVNHVIDVNFELQWVLNSPFSTQNLFYLGLVD